MRRMAMLVTATLVLLGLTAPTAWARSSERGDRRRGQDSAGKTQGRSQSDPDGTSNGGKDKPGFQGGFSEDRDGNNGCGNDDDREDDNNGNCGRQKLSGAGDGHADEQDCKVAGATKNRDDDGNGGGEVKCETVVAGDTVSLVFETKVDAVAVEAALKALVQALGLPVAAVAQPAVEAAIQGPPLPVSELPAETAVLGAQVERQPEVAAAPETEVAGAQESRQGALALTGLAIGGLALLGASLVAIGRLASRAGRT
jgi:hypothetical protein